MKRIERLTDAQRATFEPHAQKWIECALNTRPMDDTDRARMVEAMAGLYRAAGFEPPTRYAFAPSPVTGAFAATIAAGVWWLRAGDHRVVDLFGRKLTDVEIQSATVLACYVVDRPSCAVDGAVDVAVDGAVRGAVDGAVRGAVRGDQNTILRAAGFLVRCALRWYGLYRGGSVWPSWPAFISWFREAGLEIDWSNWLYEEMACAHGGARFYHREFWIVCDRPTTIGRDDQNRPHCDTGPQIAWSDGWADWYIHGVRVPRQVVEAPETLTAQQIKEETNAEVRRVMLGRFGEARYLTEIGAKKIHEDDFGELYRAELEGDEPLVMVRVLNSTPEPDGSIKPYWLRVDPTCTTAQEAIASTWRYSDTGERVFPRASDYRPTIET